MRGGMGRAAGTVTWNGGSYVDAVGKREARIDPVVAGDLLGKFRTKEFWAYCGDYTDNGLDGSSTEITVAMGGRTRTISDHDESGPEALQELLTAMPANAPAILVTQHMPPGFTTSFAHRLDQRCAMPVFEASNGQRVMPGHIYIANGSQHLELVRSGAHFACRLHDGPPVSGHRPSVDVLFASVAVAAGRNAIGVILTGMGQDGAAGLLEMRRAGARTRGQDEGSCLIYGMPKAAKLAGGVEAERPLSKMAAEILALTQERSAARVGAG